MEWILITIAIIVTFLVSTYIRKQLKPKTNLIISLIGFTGLVTMFFIRNFKDHFTSLQLIVLAVCAVGYCIYLFYRFKKINAGQTNNII